MTETTRQLLVAGIPGTGKTTFAEWLAERGWTPVDHDEVVGHGVIRNDVEGAWAAVFKKQPPAVYPFVRFARHWQTPVVIEYGLPARWWRLVVQLRAAGVVPWWFDGDRDAAYRAWQKRNGLRNPPYADFIWKRTVDEVEAHWPDLSSAFGSNVLRVVEPGPRHMLCADVLRTMFPDPE